MVRKKRSVNVCRDMEALHLSTIVLVVVCLSSTPVEAYDVSIWFEAVCGCSYTVHEQTESIQVCAEIAFINGTMETVRDYSVMISTDNSSASASSTDYFLAPVVVTFPTGSLIGDRQCVIIIITDDEIAEDNEVFHVELSTSDADVDLHSICPRASVTITDTDVITIELLESSQSVLENAGTFQICANVTHGSVEGTVNALYSTSSGTANANQDFSSIVSSILSFPPGDTVGTVRCASVSIIDDNRVESEVDQFFTFVLQNRQKTVVTQGSTVITIRDDDVAIVGMERTTVSVTEDPTLVSVCAELRNSVVLEISLSFFISTIPDTATSSAPADYNELNRQATFGSGSTVGAQVCQSISIVEDVILEYNEEFIVALSEDENKLAIELGRNVTVVTILEDEDTVEIGFEFLDYTVTESDTTQVCAQIFQFSLEREVVAYLSTVNGSGTATANNDYTSINSMGVTFVSGQSASSNPTQCTQLSNILDDEILEYDEYFWIALSSRDTEVVITTNREMANVTLREDSVDHVQIGFLPAATLVGTEGVDGTISVCPLILNGTLDREVSVFATTSAGTALDSVDYTALSNVQIVFMPGQTVGGMQCISITILDDINILEYSEYFQMSINSSSSSRVIVPPGLNTVIINIDEDPQDGITAGFQQTSYNSMETGSPQQICAQMFVGDLQRDVTLTVMSSDGSAIAPGDYLALNAQVTFTVGQRAVEGSVACTLLDIVDDNVVEVNEESLSLSLSRDEPAVTTLAASAATVVIRENDNDVPGSVVLTSPAYDAYESDGSVDVCAVIRAAALERNIIVQLSSQDITARNVEDYTSFQFVPLTFMSGQISGSQLCHNVPINDDGILEGNETFSVTLNSGEIIGTNMTQGVVTIRPDPADFVEFGILEDGYSISEQESLRDEMICTVINRGILEIEVTVDLVVQDITTQGGADYTGPSPQVLTFTSGQTVGDQRCATLSALDDSLIEDDETLNITLSSPVSGSAGAVRFTAGDKTETLTIVQDPNDRATVQLLTTTGSGLEGDDITVCSELVDNSGGLSRPISLIMMILNGTANSGVDFNGTTSYQVTFPPNSNNGDTQCISISLFTDIFFEVPENFVVELITFDPAVTVAQDANIAIFTIIDVPDPNAVAVSLRAAEYNATEGIDMTVQVCVEIVAGTVSTTSPTVAIIQTESSSATVLTTHHLVHL